MKMYYVYILKCSDGSYYTGVTNNLDLRLKQHNAGYFAGSYTSYRRPVKLAYFERFSDINLAIEWEKKIKGWSRAKKIALMNDQGKELKCFLNAKMIAILKTTEASEFLIRLRLRPA